jgi:hypothetical protein
MNLKQFKFFDKHRIDFFLSAIDVFNSTVLPLKKLMIKKNCIFVKIMPLNVVKHPLFKSNFDIRRFFDSF